MDVVNYLKQHGLEKLKEEFSIKVREYEEGLVVLNYDQIYSPKAHPIVMECRGLILDKEFNVVSRSFDRFFNIGEQPDTQAHIDMSKAVCFDKIDGSLIKIYFWNGFWHVATRGTAFAEAEVNGFDVSFKDLVMRALEMYDEEQFQNTCNSILCKDVTYICELTSMENRVVTRYEGYTLYYLAARINSTGVFAFGDNHAAQLGCSFPKQYSFGSAEDCIEAAKHLKNLDEGYVLYQEGKPVCKIKSPAYVLCHHVRGEGLNPKRLSQLVLMDEHEEYLTYFGEDRKFFIPYLEALDRLKKHMGEVYNGTEGISEQKDFALAVKDYTFSSVLFQARKSGAGTLSSIFDAQSEPHKINMLEKYLAS